MTSEAAISDIRFAEASAALRSKGTIGWVICSYGGLQLDCLRVRRLPNGEYGLSFPSRRDSNGVMHAIVRPLDQAARDAIEEQVLGELRRRGRLP